MSGALSSATRDPSSPLRGFDRLRSVAAAGASIGSIGLAAFALAVWKTIPNHSPWLALLGAILVWMTLSVLLWQIRKRFAPLRRRIKRAPVPNE